MIDVMIHESADFKPTASVERFSYESPLTGKRYVAVRLTSTAMFFPLSLESLERLIAALQAAVDEWRRSL